MALPGPRHPVRAVAGDIGRAQAGRDPAGVGGAERPLADERIASAPGTASAPRLTAHPPPAWEPARRFPV